MKTTILILLMNIIFAFSSNCQDLTVHNAKVVGKFDVGNQQVTIFYDEESICFRKSTLHTPNIFVYNEFVLIYFDNNKSYAEIYKPSLLEVVNVNKICQQEETEINLTLDENTISMLDVPLSVIQKSFAGIIKKPEIQISIKEFLIDNQRDEKIYFQELETKLLQKGIILLDLLKESLIFQGGQMNEINILTNTYKTVVANGKVFDVFFHVPYSETFGMKENYIITKDIRLNTTDKLFGIKTNILNGFINEELIESSIDSNTVITISVSDGNNHSISKAIGWQKCHCTRSTKLPDGQISSKGSCSTNGTCGGDCGRTGLFNNECPTTNCPGC
jgi:hypothetical protein